MTTGDTIREALQSLGAHRLRAGLSVLGVVVGVATVVSALAIANGARRQAMEDIGALGLQNVLIRSPLSFADLDALRAEPRVSAVAARRSVADAVSFDGRTIPARIAGVTVSWRDTARLAAARGRWIGTDETDRVAVIGSALASDLFGGRDPVGETAIAAGEWRTIVGVLPASAGRASSSAIQTIDADRAIFVPWRTLDVPIAANDPGDTTEEVVVRATPGTNVGALAVRLERRLRALRPDLAAVDIVVPQELLRARLRAQRTFNALLLSIGALALVVSGVGIANIMVASVTERTAEIGVRRAVGARRASILWQFTLEALILSCAGGLAGLPIGIAGAAAASWLAGWPIALSVSGVALALASAAAIGLAAGIYPARQAAAISPIAALTR